MYPDLKIAKQQIIFAPTHCFDNKNEIMSISQMYRIIGTVYDMKICDACFKCITQYCCNKYVFCTLNITKIY